MNQELRAAIELGRTLRDKAIAEYEEEERQREYQHQQKIMEMWVPYIAAVRAVVPSFVGVVAPKDDEPSFRPGTYDDKQYRPISVDVGEGIPPLRAWTDCSTRADGTPAVIFCSGRWTLYCPEDTGKWIVAVNYGTHTVNSYQIGQASTNEFYLALAEAAEEANIYPQRLADAQRLNEEAAAYKEAIKFEKDNNLPPPIIDPMERIANYLERIAALYEQHHRF